MTDLLRKNCPKAVQWTTECKKAFHTLKSLLCSSPVLQAPNNNRPFILQTDASDHGIGAILSQVDDNGVEHAVSHYSRRLVSREERYAAIEKCLAIKSGVQVFRHYLLRRPFVIQTDHHALQWLDRMKDNNNRLTRWSLSLQPYRYTIKYHAGKPNGTADGLSRVPLSDMDVAGEVEGSVMQHNDRNRCVN